MADFTLSYVTVFVCGDTTTLKQLEGTLNGAGASCQRFQTVTEMLSPANETPTLVVLDDGALGSGEDWVELIKRIQGEFAMDCEVIVLALPGDIGY